MRAKLKMIKEEMRRRMHQPIPSQGKWLWHVVAATSTTTQCRPMRGHWTCSGTMSLDLWRRTLRRRSQKDRITWARMTQLADDWLPKPIILHPWPSVALCRHTPEVGAVCGKAARTDLCGGREVTRVPTATKAPAKLARSVGASPTQVRP